MQQEAVPPSKRDRQHSSAGQLGPLLCWAVVFADIGSSIYYVPGILYGRVGALAGFFVLLTLSVFVLLTLKHAEVSARFPEGGGVVTVAAQAMHSWVGALIAVGSDRAILRTVLSHIPTTEPSLLFSNMSMQPTVTPSEILVGFAG